MVKSPSGPCVISNPNSTSVEFGGVYINQSEIARLVNRHYSYISLILAGKREPGLHVAQEIAKALNITVEDLVYAIEDRKLTKKYGPKVAV